ncbi:hypothetical protein JL193_08035 [Polaribacter batillariae]|uniref:Uncharacterized protein n=1 Tax=Polaribacter batillariae TaxID=2808900 RepID=A0ABX7SY39_9FLAO|nr:hypothetical protein [Polaribacter batillariae]QTD39175.1 hypothetical protein JL193_08035 [Polaribacter batillariae]
MPQYNEEGELTRGAETLLEFKTLPGSTSSSILTTHLSTTICYKPNETLDRYIVTLNKLTTEKTFNAFTGINSGGDGISQFTTSQKFGEYHLYQPISLLGYEENLNLKVPDVDAIPVFLFYYAEEFDRIYDIDATINFVGEVVLEVGFFFLFGGAGTLRHLQHFRKLTKLRHLRPTLNAEGFPIALEFVASAGVTVNDSLIVFKAFSSATEVVSVSASILMSFFTFKEAQTNDSAEAEACRKIANVFMYMAIATGVGSGLSRAKANKIADDVLDNTSPSVLSQFPDDVIDILRDLRTKKTNLLLNFGTTLDSLGVTSPNILGTFYDALNNLPEIKDLFYRDFNELTDINLWNRLNNTDVLNRWQQMAELGITERRNLNILEDITRVNAIVRYYGEDVLKNVLEGLSFEKRWVFLVRRGDVDPSYFDKLKLNPVAINLHIASYRRPEGALYLMRDDQVFDFVVFNNNPVHTGLLIELQKPNVAWSDITSLYRQNADLISITNSEVLEISARYIDDLEQMGNTALAKSARRVFKQANKLYTKQCKVFNNADLIEDVDTSNINFISGKMEELNTDFFNNTLVPQNIKNKFHNTSDVLEQNAYKTFTDSAHDSVKNYFRSNDTEVKFINWFLNTQWHRGNKFDIELDSLLYACHSCQRYLAMLVENGKTINIKFNAHPDVTKLRDLRKLN